MPLPGSVVVALPLPPLLPQPVIVAAADYGQICAHQLNGLMLWSEKSFTSLGDMFAAGDGDTILLAGFNHGIQALDLNGSLRDSYLIEGTVSRVGCSFTADRIAAVARPSAWVFSTAGNTSLVDSLRAEFARRGMTVRDVRVEKKTVLLRVSAPGQPRTAPP